jgi:hypothetical protein
MTAPISEHHPQISKRDSTVVGHFNGNQSFHHYFEQAIFPGIWCQGQLHLALKLLSSPPLQCQCYRFSQPKFSS